MTKASRGSSGFGATKKDGSGRQVEVFPRFHTHVSWRQRWHYGTGKDVLLPREQPLRGVQIDYAGASSRVRIFRQLFHSSMAQIATALQAAREVIRGGR